MIQYFEEGDRFTWIRDRDATGETMTVPLVILREQQRSRSKQAVIAEDANSKKLYFMKVLFCDEMDRFYVEKESKVQLYSPFIVRIYGGMLDAEHDRFITLVEFLPGRDLSDLVSGHLLAGRTWNEKIRVCNTIALKFLCGIDHYMSLYEEDPIIHRDLKPENVMASPDGSTVKIIDFDWVHLHDSSATFSGRREQKGTPGYADPKYWNSYICRPEMDIYSAGLVLYFIYTGRHHFHGSEEINRYMVGDSYAYTLKEMPGIDEQITRIIARMIAPEEERYSRISDVIRDLTAYLEERGRMPELPELLDNRDMEDVVRFSYRVGDVKYSPYVRNYRFVPIEFGTRQERSQNGRLSDHIMSFYRVGDRIRAVVLNEDCHPILTAREDRVSEGDLFTYAGCGIEVTGIRHGKRRKRV